MRRLTVIIFFVLLAVSAWAYAPERRSLPRIDAENRLTTNWVAGAWKQEFVYDGFGRKRIERTYGWQTNQWVQTNEVRWVWDRMLPLQERNRTNGVLVTYTRGLDLSGSLQGAGGIGGLLARTQPSTTSPQHAYYHADGAGNVTSLIDERNNIAARYACDPFGRQVGQWGPMAEANHYRFSSKEEIRGFYDYRHRFYSPVLQRWLNPEPIGEAGSINLYRFVRNSPLVRIDPDGAEDFLLFDFQSDFNSPGWRQGTAEGLRLAGPAAAEIGASTIPGVGELMDLQVLGDPASRWWEKALAGMSLGLNVLTEGLLPNAGGMLRGGKRLCKEVSESPKLLGPGTRFTPKIEKQLPKRGWTKRKVESTIDHPAHTSAAMNKASNRPATAYFDNQGAYIVRDNVTGEIIQVSDRLDPNWVPDSSIVNPPVP